MIFNLNNYEVHNNYTFSLYKDKKLIKEKTVFNRASSGRYIADIGSSSTSSTTLFLIYKGFSYDENEERIENDFYSTNTTTISFTRTTSAENINFGTPIQFKGTVTFSSSSSFIGHIYGAGLGSEKIVVNDEGKEEDFKNRVHWSDAEINVIKEENTTLIITVTLYISAAIPNLPYIYNKDITSILNKDNGSFPTPAPSWLGMSAFDLSVFPSGSVLSKKIPVFSTLPKAVYTNRDGGIGENSNYCIKNIKNSSLEEKKDYLFLPAVGSGEGDTHSNYNYGNISTFVIGDIGAAPFNYSFAGSSANNVLLPFAKLTKDNLESLLEQEPVDGYYWFYCSIPKNCQKNDNIDVNGIASEMVGITWKDPNDLNNIEITAVGMTTDEKVSINNYKSTNIGTYYANYLFGDYWEPPSGSSVCPNYIYFSAVPKYIYLGNGTTIKIQGKNNETEEWDNLLNANIAYRSYTLDVNTELYSEYRGIVSTLSTNSTNYYVNGAETTVVPNKTYDKNILRIGDENNNFGASGVGISKNIIENWRDALNSEQTEVIYYTLSLSLSISGFYKSANTISYMKYEVTVNGNN